MEDFLTWEILATSVGAVLVVTTATQYLKPLFKKLNTRLLVLIESVIIMVIVTAFQRGGAFDYVLALINSFLIMSSALGLYEVSFAKLDQKKKEEIENGK